FYSIFNQTETTERKKEEMAMRGGGGGGGGGQDDRRLFEQICFRIICQHEHKEIQQRSTATSANACLILLSFAQEKALLEAHFGKPILSLQKHGLVDVSFFFIAEAC
ncbi:hypothetical protein ACJX0J_030955, partial [Zea mays]